MSVFAKVFQTYKNEKVRLSFQDKNCSLSCSPTGTIHGSLISADVHYKPEDFKTSKESKVTWQRRFLITSLNGNIVVFLSLSKECLLLIICFYFISQKVLVCSRLEIKQSKTERSFQLDGVDY